IDPNGIALVLALPWIALAFTDSVSAAGATFRDAFVSSPTGAPPDRLAATRSRLRFVASASVAAGTLAASMLLGPLYGVAFKTFLYDPAESALAVADGELVDIFE
ncbi:MAG: hypothetical protein AAGG01_24045, partial [Planctomycetota bacterium]